MILRLLQDDLHLFRQGICQPDRMEARLEQIQMRVTISHNRSKEEVMRSIDRSFDDLFKGAGFIPIQMVNQHRSWSGSRLGFSFDAKAGILSTPIKGFVDVTEKDVTIEADLGLLERLLPGKRVSKAIASQVRGLIE